jgi:Fe-S-cluster-containing dehydrogenase component
MVNAKDQREAWERMTDSLNLDPRFSRRQFLKFTGVAIVGISALSPLWARGASAPLIIMDQAEGLVIADPTKCVGCCRCELACTEFNDGKAKPSMARVKVARNMNFGPKGVYAGNLGEGNWGNGLIMQDLCKQCPHPVPCANACPNDAIVSKAPLNARFVVEDICIGCKMCQRACPWEMMSFDTETNKATKCFLCDGKPKCVEACPAEALSYVAWRDLTDKVPPRVVPTAVVSPQKAAACMECHGK